MREKRFKTRSVEETLALGERIAACPNRRPAMVQAIRVVGAIRVSVLSGP